MQNIEASSSCTHSSHTAHTTGCSLHRLVVVVPRRWLASLVLAICLNRERCSLLYWISLLYPSSTYERDHAVHMRGETRIISGGSVRSNSRPSCSSSSSRAFSPIRPTGAWGRPCARALSPPAAAQSCKLHLWRSCWDASHTATPRGSSHI